MKHTVSAFALMAGCVWVQPVWAQNSGTDSAAPVGLGDIVVTAQKRSERLQDVPISVAALDSGSLARNQISSTADLEMVVPALVTNELAGFSQTFLRGVGTDIQSPSAEGGVANYTDGVYNPFVSSLLTGLLGTERIEVLYGPQGTLYGRNAVGGAINTVTRSPGKTLQAAFNATYGNFDRTDLAGFVSGPITDKISVGVYGGVSLRDTFYDITSPLPLGSTNKQKSIAGRIKVVAEPTDSLKITGSFEYQYTKGFEQTAFRQIQANAPGFLLAPTLLRYNAIQLNFPVYMKADQLRAILQVDKSLGDLDLVSITAYQRYNDEGSLDVDATSAPFVGAFQKNPGLYDLSQELRLQSAAGAKISWVGGLYYARNLAGFFPNYSTLQDAVADPNLQLYTRTRVKTDSMAVFGQVTVPFTDKLSLTLGARYSRDKKRFVYGQASTIVADTGEVLSDQTFPQQSRAWSAFTPKVTLSYTPVDRVMFYATFSQGYKSGQFGLANPSDPGPVNPEKLTDIEGGFKTELFNRRVRFNGSIFHYDYKDLQVYLSRLTGDGQLTSILVNAAKAELYGGDVSATVLVVPGLTLSGGAAYTHSRYKSFPSFAGTVPAEVGNVSKDIVATGNRVQRAPEWTTNLGIDYTTELANGGKVFANAQWSHNSGFYWDPSNLYRQSAYNVVNASAGYTLPGNQITLTAWVKNLSDQAYEKIVFAYSLGQLAQDAAPRMYGVTVGFKY